MEQEDFLTHLWALINEEDSPVTWKESGKEFCIDFDKLDLHLKSESIFSANNQTDFVKELLRWGFRRTGSEDLSEEECMEVNPREIFAHEYFRRNNPNLLTLMAPQQRERKNRSVFVKEDYVGELRGRDLCYSSVQKQSRMERERNHLAAVEGFGMLQRNLHEQIMRKKTMNFSTGEGEMKSIGIEKSVSDGDMAGSYGIEKNEKLKEFFGSYIPTYEVQNSTNLPANFNPKATSSRIWETSVNSPEAARQEDSSLSISSIRMLPPDDGSSSTEYFTTASGSFFDRSLQLQESFDVLNN